jgi:hypothetical protein
MSHPIRQVETHKVTLRTVMRRASFVHGHRSFLQGKPLVYDAYPHCINEQWSYERGRQFAALWPHPVKNKATIRMDALRAYAAALNRRDVI